VDILTAFRALVAREPRQLGVLCGRSNSPLANAARDHGFTDLLLYELPTGKDGFLATNSLLGFVTLLMRAYASEFEDPSSDFHSQASAIHSLLLDETRWTEWRSTTAALWHRNTTLVLHGSTTRVGAIDLESKFTEAAVGNLQIADYRNFAHGRHLWLAKRAKDSGVLALVSSADQALADQTLALIPKEIPQVRLFIDGPPETALLLSLIAALWITGWAGEARGIDPGRPGVPEFGRKLYHLPLPKEPPRIGLPAINDDDAVAIERKSGLSLARLIKRGELEPWCTALKRFRSRLAEASFAGVALDYDGTVVDTRERFSPPRGEIVSELIRIVRSGALVAIATGRGTSIRHDLQKLLPADLWQHVVIGYYNGAEIAALADEHAPDNRDGVCDSLAPVAAALREQSELADIAVQTERRFQITLQARRPTPEGRLWDLAQQTVLMAGQRHVTITRSSHSIDIVATDVSKLNVLKHLRERVGDAPVLTVGDRGRWPGNDYELLKEPFSLSVDELSADPNTCWNLAPRGQRGIAATLCYLKALTAADAKLRFDLPRLQ
jgi:trehalose-6-phosphatase